MLLLLFQAGEGGGVVDPPAPAVEARSKGGWDPYYYKRRKKHATPEPEVLEERIDPLPDDVREPVGIKPITLPIGPNVMAPVAAAQIVADHWEELAEMDDEDVLLLAA